VRLDRRDVIRSRLSRSYGDWTYYRAGLTISGTLVQPRSAVKTSPHQLIVWVEADGNGSAAARACAPDDS
jgi:hypothetical protein